MENINHQTLPALHLEYMENINHQTFPALHLVHMENIKHQTPHAVHLEFMETVYHQTFRALHLEYAKYKSPNLPCFASGMDNIIKEKKPYTHPTLQGNISHL